VPRSDGIFCEVHTLRGFFPFLIPTNPHSKGASSRKKRMIIPLPRCRRKGGLVRPERLASTLFLGANYGGKRWLTGTQKKPCITLFFFFLTKPLTRFYGVRLVSSQLSSANPLPQLKKRRPRFLFCFCLCPKRMTWRSPKVLSFVRKFTNEETGWGQP
jgi:hypothetical protein